MVIINFILSFAIELAQMAFLLALSIYIITLVDKTIGKQGKLSFKDILLRRCLVSKRPIQNICIVLLFILFISTHIFVNTYPSIISKQALLLAVILMLMAINSKFSTYIYIICSTIILMSLEQISLIKDLVSYDWAINIIELTLVDYGLVLKAISLVFALSSLKNTFKIMVKNYSLGSLITSCALAVFIIKENFLVFDFSFVLVNNIEFEFFTRSLMSYASVCMHYISIYLLTYLYVFVGKRPLRFINQL